MSDVPSSPLPSYGSHKDRFTDWAVRVNFLAKNRIRCWGEYLSVSAAHSPYYSQCNCLQLTQRNTTDCAMCAIISRPRV
jgi:hypothetical protein